MRETSSGRPIIDMVQSFSDLLEQGSRMGLDLLESLSRTRMPEMMSGMMEQFGSAMSLPKKTCGCQPRSGGCGCKIPPPCWAPQCMGEVTSHVCPGGTATLQITVTNSSSTRGEIELEVGGNAKGVTLTPASLSLGPMERGSVVASAAMPAEASHGEEHEIRLWVHGCRDHFLCWTVKVAKRGTDCCCHEVDVCDGPDWIHHWYDHFYCERPCGHGTH
jgi:hypothetical protein